MKFKKKYNDFILKDDYAIMLIKRNNEIIRVLLDIEDVDKVRNIGSWHAIIDKTLQTTSYYIAHRFNNKANGKGVIKLHRLITNCPKDKMVDHINHDTLDNRKQNLKICTHFENQQNSRSRKSTHTGVFRRTRTRNNKTRSWWTATISKNKIRYTKDCKTMEEAISWRLQKEKELYKEMS